MSTEALLNEISSALADIVDYIETGPGTKGVEALDRMAKSVAGLAEVIGKREGVDFSPLVAALQGLKITATFSPQITVQPAPVPQHAARTWEFTPKYKPNGEIECITAKAS